MIKDELIQTIIQELRRAQTERWVPPPDGPVKELRLPPSLPLDDGRQLHVTEELLDAVSQYASLYMANKPALRARFKIDELRQLAARAFGKRLAKIDLDNPNDELCGPLKAHVDEGLTALVTRHRQTVIVVVGCHLLRGHEAYPITIGPAAFAPREQWLQRSNREGKVSDVTARRLTVAWSGGRLRPRKLTYDEHGERAIRDAVGDCPVICTVATDGLSSKMIQEKSLLAARMAMVALSLMWAHPSQGLEWMNLLYDGRTFRRCYALFEADRFRGSSSSISQLPLGRWTDAELIAELRAYQPLFDQIGEALFNYVQPTRGLSRPNMMNALFLSLWWFHEACREPSDQMATTKFAASMDALSGGNKAKGIVKFISVRLGFGPDAPLMKNGRTTKNVVASFYGAGRSRLIHGSSNDFAHDWSQIRSTAEAVGRQCLVRACDWMTKNREVDDISKLSMS